MKDFRPISIEAMTEISAIVKRTLGPGGNAILLQRVGQGLDGSPLGPKITKDGVSVADECESDSPEKDVVIQAIKAICKKTNTSAGDGTTTAIVLGESILKETLAVLEADSNLNPQLVKESIEKASLEVLAKLKKLAIKVKDLDKIKQVATISANGDEEIGEIIKQAFDHVGAEGVVTVDEGHTSKVTIEKVEGYQFSRGAEARTSFFNNRDLTHYEAEGVAVLIYDGKLLNFNNVIPALKCLAGVGEDGRPTRKLPPLLIVANEFSPEVLQFLLIQKTEAGMSICPIIGPNTTHVRTSYYDDLAAYTGATRLGDGTRNMNSIELEDFGQAGKVIIDKYKTTIYEGQGDEQEILARVEQMKAAKALAESPYDAQLINDRIAALTNGIAKIGVGGQTELEIKEKYDRIEDALNAARAAIEEGVVPGGGTTLFRIAQGLNAQKSIGHKILQIALQAPFCQILENIGMKEIDIAKYALEIVKGNSKVFDARNKIVRNAMSSGIIDPVKVTRTALQNAVSIATLLSTAGGAIIYINPKN